MSDTAAGLPGNYCKVPGCTESFAYDHRCERHSDDDEPATAASDDENTEMEIDYTGWNRPATTAAPEYDRGYADGYTAAIKDVQVEFTPLWQAVQHAVGLSHALDSFIIERRKVVPD